LLAHISLEKLCEFLPQLKTRSYSLTHISKEELGICFTEETFSTPFSETCTISKQGVCSHYMRSLVMNDSFTLSVGFKSAFPIIKDIYENSHPVIVLAHGTAITPFMSVF